LSPNIVIYLIDCLRADHVGAYVYDRDTTPNIDQFAASATVYEQAQTAATWTHPSVASLLTGLSPFVHGAMHRTTDKLQEWPVMLPEVLQAAGYQTAGIVTNTAVNAACGFNQGCDFFKYHCKYPTQWLTEQSESRARLAPGYVSSGSHQRGTRAGAPGTGLPGLIAGLPADRRSELRPVCRDGALLG